MIMRVQQLCNKNQFEIVLSGGVIFQSYESLVALKMGSRWVVNESYYKYSNTTTKHTCIFFGYSNAKEFHADVKDSVYIELLDNADFMELVDQLMKGVE